MIIWITVYYIFSTNIIIIAYRLFMLKLLKYRIKVIVLIILKL